MDEEKFDLQGTITLSNEDNIWNVNTDVYNSEDFISESERAE